MLLDRRLLFRRQDRPDLRASPCCRDSHVGFDGRYFSMLRTDAPLVDSVSAYRSRERLVRRPRSLAERLPLGFVRFSDVLDLLLLRIRQVEVGSEQAEHSHRPAETHRSAATHMLSA